MSVGALGKHGGGDLASTAAESNQASIDLVGTPRRRTSAELPYEITELRTHIAAKVGLLYGRHGSLADLVRKSELADECTLRRLRGACVPLAERRALEMACLMLVMVKERSGTQEAGNGDDTVVCDISTEVYAATAPEEMKYEKLREPVAELLTLCAIWAIEAARGTNLSKLAYDLLFNLSRFRVNQHLKRYVASFLEDTERLCGDEQYWRLRLLHSSIKNGDIASHDYARLVRHCVGIAKHDNTIYVTDVVTSLLAELWEIYPCALGDLWPRARYSLMGKLLVRGVATEQVVQSLVHAAISGPYYERKIAIDALVKSGSIQQTESIGRFLPHSMVLPEADLGILSVGAAILRDEASALLYVRELCHEIAKLLRMKATSLEELCMEAKVDISNVTAEGDLPDVTQVHVRSACKNFFAIRDIVSAICAALQRMRAMEKEYSAEPAKVDAARRTVELNNVTVVLVYLAIIREQLTPYVMGAVEAVMRLAGLPMNILAFCVAALRNCKTGGILCDQLAVVTCKLASKTVECCIIRRHTLKEEVMRAVSQLVLEVAETMHVVVVTLGKNSVRYKCAPHVAETIAWLASLASAMPWNADMRDLARRVANTLKRILRYHLLPVKRERDSHGNSGFNQMDVKQYRGATLVYIASAFEMLCRTLRPNAEMVRMMLSALWNPDIATTTFSALETLVASNMKDASVTRAIVTYLLKTPLHTDWDAQALCALHELVDSLRRGLIRKHAAGGVVKERLFVKYVPTFGLAARRKVAGPWRPGKVKLGGQGYLATFLRQFMINVVEEANRMPVALRQPVALLDENMLIPQAIKETRMHDCPGE
ncbi:AarF/ABC1/UbiB kinase family protein [Babesia caballi]|uniref:AarF/ABC1/UbiB kinase family protein n=1 Tax=Babesia caballi TaxID=5871 RepID=A0AAV4LVG2_BABCB|nr:AarF/ABC1/UbiB kinase family protein [Babesia caballi]